MSGNKRKEKKTPIPCAAALRAWCQERGITREGMGTIIGRDPRTISRIWGGERDLSRLEWDALQRETEQ